MGTFTSRVSPKGEITLPRELLENLCLKTGNQVVLRLEGDSIKILPVKGRLAVDYGLTPRFPLEISLEEAIRIATEEHARHVAAEGL